MDNQITHLPPAITPTAVDGIQSLIDTGWRAPEGNDLRYAATLARPRRWRPRPGADVLAALRDWIWTALIETDACSRAQAARVACIHRGIGRPCGACTGSGIDSTGPITMPLALLPYQEWIPPQRPRCRICAGIGLTALPLLSAR